MKGYGWGTERAQGTAKRERGKQNRQQGRWSGQRASAHVTPCSRSPAAQTNMQRHACRVSLRAFRHAHAHARTQAQAYAAEPNRHEHTRARTGGDGAMHWSSMSAPSAYGVEARGSGFEFTPFGVSASEMARKRCTHAKLGSYPCACTVAVRVNIQVYDPSVGADRMPRSRGRAHPADDERIQQQRLCCRRPRQERSAGLADTRWAGQAFAVAGGDYGNGRARWPAIVRRTSPARLRIEKARARRQPWRMSSLRSQVSSCDGSEGDRQRSPVGQIGSGRTSDGEAMTAVTCAIALVALAQQRAMRSGGCCSPHVLLAQHSPWWYEETRLELMLAHAHLRCCWNNGNTAASE